MGFRRPKLTLFAGVVISLVAAQNEFPRYGIMNGAKAGYVSVAEDVGVSDVTEKEQICLYSVPTPGLTDSPLQIDVEFGWPACGGNCTGREFSRTLCRDYRVWPIVLVYLNNFLLKFQKVRWRATEIDALVFQLTFWGQVSLAGIVHAAFNDLDIDERSFQIGQGAFGDAGGSTGGNCRYATENERTNYTYEAEAAKPSLESGPPNTIFRRLSHAPLFAQIGSIVILGVLAISLVIFGLVDLLLNDRRWRGSILLLLGLLGWAGGVVLCVAYAG